MPKKKEISSHLKQLANEYITEFLKCKSDFIYFAKTYVYLELPGGDRKFRPYKKQLELVHLVEKTRYALVLKSRQIGISTIIQVYVAWLVTFFDNAVIGIISKDGKEATDFARAIRGMVEKLPDWMKPPKGIMGKGFAKRTEQSFILTNGSKVYASPVNPNAPEKTLRGKALTFLVIDEAAFIHHIDTAWTSLVPALSTNQKAAKKYNIPYGTVVLSTPNKTMGVGQWYFEKYIKAVSKDDIFEPFVIHWKMIPELAQDPDWYNTQCRLFGNDHRKIAQELDLKFLPSEGSFFEADTVEKMQDGIKQPMQVLKLFGGEIWRFTEPIKTKTYIIGVDTAPEHGSDKSAITIWDYETLEQVWEYQGKCKVLDFVKVVKVAASEYPGILVVESNSYGNQVVEYMNASEYSFMLYKEKRGVNTIVPGLSTNMRTRPLMIDALYSYMSQFPNSVKSERLVLELTGLVAKGEKVEADKGCHDDLAMSAALCFYVRKYDPPLLLDSPKYENISREMLDIVAMNMEEEVTVGFNNKDIASYARKLIENQNKESNFIDTLQFFRE
jgi:hypothetical protein